MRSGGWSLVRRMRGGLHTEVWNLSKPRTFGDGESHPVVTLVGVTRKLSAK